MALVARCPNCLTVFRVTPLHLQAHGGEVRCGQCNHIFNGFAALLTMEEPEIIKPVKTAEAAKAPENTSQLSPDVGISHPGALQDGGVPEPVMSEPHISEPPSAQNPPGPLPAEPTGSAPVKPEAAEARAPETPAREKPDARAAKKADKARDRRVAREQIPQTGNGMYAGLEDDMLDNYLPEHYVSRRGQLPEITAAWAVANLFMLIVLVAQIIYAFRSDLAVNMPSTRPFLEQYCKVLQCTVSLSPSTGSENTASSGMSASPSIGLAVSADKQSSVFGHYRWVHSPCPTGRVV
ncbi:MJ0042 family finger-like domain-containing protein [Nitrosospira multiformis]|uniref:MJ0042 family finger-like domain-containing protein n=1 Tax=Nitrosospira multiformis TaxID=1231 RepID=A0A1H8LZ46_9PROT|nr:DUF3426 domain-containing protein [Nitrosospira multiformis]SEO10290.1 MJ0042 family finger-like domain-containing protein [Nitrosospira multiformis]